jgi:hypothetical protein
LRAFIFALFATAINSIYSINKSRIAKTPKIIVNIIAGDRSPYFVKLISPVMKVAMPVISIETPIVLACILPRGVIPLLTPIIIVMRHKRKIISSPKAYLPSSDLGIFFSLFSIIALIFQTMGTYI